MAGVIRREVSVTSQAFSFEDLDRQAERLLRQAEQRARELMDAARQSVAGEIDQIRKQAYQEGLQEGRRAGTAQAREEAGKTALQEARARLNNLTQSLGVALTEYEQARHRLLGQAETELIRLALAVATRVCRLHVERSFEPARTSVLHLLELVRHEADLELHVNPAEHEFLTTVVADFVRTLERSEHVTLVPDETVNRGGCLLRSRYGTIDATLETQLQRVAEAILGNAECRTQNAEGAASRAAADASVGALSERPSQASTDNI